MISCVLTEQHSQDKVNLLLLIVCLKCLLLACTVNCAPVKQAPRQQYQEEHTTGVEAGPIMSPIDQGRILPGRPEYLASTQMLGRPDFREIEQTKRRRTWEGKRDAGNQDDTSEGHFGEFNVIRYVGDPAVTSEGTDFSLLEGRGDTSYLVSPDEMDRVLQHEDLIRLRTERRGRIKHDGYGIVLEDTSSRRHQPVKLQSIPIEEFQRQIEIASTRHDILRIFYGPNFTNTQLDYFYDTTNQPTRKTALQFQSPMASRPVYNSKRVALTDIRPESTSALEEQGTLQDDPTCEKCSPISASKRFKSSLKTSKNNNNKQRRHTNKSLPRSRRHNKHKQGQRAKKKSRTVTTDEPVTTAQPDEQNSADLSEALKHVQEMKNILDDLACRPTPAVISVKDIARSANKMHFPKCTIMYRCQQSTSCCTVHGEVCMPKTVEYVVRTFVAVPWENDVSVAPTTESFVFENHTECECRQNQKTITECKKCPLPFMKYYDSDDNTCHCGCVEGRNLKLCRKIIRGNDNLEGEEYKCVENETCAIPDCPHGQFNVTKGRCPKKKEMKHHSRSGENNKAKKKKVIKNDNDRRNHHDDNKGDVRHNRNKGAVRSDHVKKENARTHHSNKGDVRREHVIKNDARIHHGNKGDVRSDHGSKGDVRSEHVIKDDVRIHHGNKGDVRSEHVIKDDVRIHHGNKGDVRSDHGNKGDGHHNEKNKLKKGDRGIIHGINEDNINNKTVKSNGTNHENILKGNLTVEGGIVMNEHNLAKVPNSRNFTVDDFTKSLNVSKPALNVSFESGDGETLIINGSGASNITHEDDGKHMHRGDKVINKSNSSESLVDNNEMNITKNIQQLSKKVIDEDKHEESHNETMDAKKMLEEMEELSVRSNMTDREEKSQMQMITEQSDHTLPTNNSEIVSTLENIDVEISTNASNMEAGDNIVDKVQVNETLNLKDIFVLKHDSNNSDIIKNGSDNNIEVHMTGNGTHHSNIDPLIGDQGNLTDNNHDMNIKSVRTELIKHETNKTLEDLGSSGSEAAVEN